MRLIIDNSYIGPNPSGAGSFLTKRAPDYNKIFGCRGRRVKKNLLRYYDAPGARRGRGGNKRRGYDSVQMVDTSAWPRGSCVCVGWLAPVCSWLLYFIP